MSGAAFLGFDTSNYTTSTALFVPDTGEILQQKRLLPVKQGALGLRQSDAVFEHTRQMRELFEQLMQSYDGQIEAVGVSVRPRDVEGSYMPCFLVGMLCAGVAGDLLRVPVYPFSHQAGHVAAAVMTSGATHLFDQRFLAFHLSGGTTEALLVQPAEDGGSTIEQVGGSTDLKAGQLIDRVGGMLGLPFPAGPHLEVLAEQSTTELPVHIRPQGAQCSFSGVQNQCEQLLKKGAAGADVARFCLRTVEAALCSMIEALREQYGPLPVVCAGGVMSNRAIRDTIERRYGAVFCPPQYSADNAAGIAVLAARKAGRV